MIIKTQQQTKENTDNRLKHKQQSTVDLVKHEHIDY